MKIFLKELTLRNFKGIRELNMDFTSNNTNIYGKNATGKSSIVDAFTWVLFHKNADDKSDFSIKTLDTENKAIPKLEHSVKAILEVDGNDIEFEKIYREKWEVENGDSIEKFKGHESKHFVDGVPLSKSEYDKKVQGIINSDIFKLVTNPSYFCLSVKWQERRNLLFSLAPTITDNDIISENQELFNPLVEILKKYEIEDYKKKLKSSIVKINTQIDEIPPRIDEAHRSMPEPVDVESVQALINEKEAEINKLDNQLTEASVVFEDYNKIQQKIFKLQKQQNEICNNIENEFQGVKYKEKNKLTELKWELESLQKYELSRKNLIISTEKKLTSKTEERQMLLDEWHAKHAEELQFNEENFICPTCSRPFEEHSVEEQKIAMKSNFNKKKVEILSSISTKGKVITSEMEQLEELISSTKDRLMSDGEMIQAKEKAIEEQSRKLENLTIINGQDTEEYKALQQEIDAFKAKLEVPQFNTDEITREKSKINLELNDLKKQLSTVEIISRTKERIEELYQQEKDLAIQKAKYQKALQMCDSFIKTKIEKVENSVNSLFKYVKFKLFETQVNGGEKECCEVLIDGVPYSDANRAAKINAGLDVINAISMSYDVKAPIFIDNRESVNDLIACDSQLINLFVTSDDEKLRSEVA